MLTEDQQRRAVKLMQECKEAVWCAPRYSIIAMALYEILEEKEFKELLKPEDDDIFS